MKKVPATPSSVAQFPPSKEQRLIVFEGIDGTGKSTQVERLAEFLRGKGQVVVTSFEPTNGEYGRRLRDSAESGRLEPQEELDLFIADRRQHVETVIRPALNKGSVVILDRYYFSTLAYQTQRGFDLEELRELNESFAPRPGLLILLELPVSAALARIGSRDGNANSFERQEALEKCAEVFSSLTDTQIQRVNAEQSPEDVAQEIAHITAAHLNL